MCAKNLYFHVENELRDIGQLNTYKFRQPFHAEQNTRWTKSGARPRGAVLPSPNQNKKNVYMTV